jgi:hypothetical protein
VIPGTQRDSKHGPACRFPASWRYGAALLLLATVLLMGACPQERVIGLNQRIHHDDFEYRVTQFSVADAIGSGASRQKPAGRFYIVTFEVANLAKRVNHEWDNSIAYIVDESGRKYENLPAAQALLNAVNPFNFSSQHCTPAGATENTQLVFDIPSACTHPYLLVRGDLLMGDVFDAKAFARTKVKLF